jgi:UDP-N-acetylmuramyl tripeptide synthase
MEIINQVAQGALEEIRVNPRRYPRQSAVYKILDRREAIREALKLAKENDTIIITGKGCEPSICLTKGKRIPWDDREVVRGEFENLRNSTNK